MEPLTPFKATNKQESGIYLWRSQARVYREDAQTKEPHAVLVGGREVTSWGGNCHL